MREPSLSWWCLVTGQQAMGAYRKFYFSVRNSRLFYCRCGQTVEQVAQRDCGISILGGSKTQLDSPEQPAVADPALSRAAGWDQRSLQPQLFCDAVILWAVWTCNCWPCNGQYWGNGHVPLQTNSLNLFMLPTHYYIKPQYSWPPEKR